MFKKSQLLYFLICFLLIIFSYFFYSSFYGSIRLYLHTKIDEKKIQEEKKYYIDNNIPIYKDYDSLETHNPSIELNNQINISQNDLNDPDNQKLNWLLPNFNYSNTRFYPGNQINTTNVKRLKLAFTLDTDVFASIQSSPIVIGKFIFVSTSFNNVYAFDALSGKRYWHYKYSNPWFKYKIQSTNKGISIKDNKIFLATNDSHLIALNAKNGREIWKSVIDKSLCPSTSAPIPINDYIIVGCGNNDIHNFVKAFYIKNGQLAWSFYTAPVKGQEGVWASKDVLGINRRNIAYEKMNFLKSTLKGYGGAGVVNSPSIDIKTKTIFFVTGDPYPSQKPNERPGDNLYSNSIIALDLETGKYKWHYQYLPHDTLDLDFLSPTIIFEDRNKIPSILSSGKVGRIFVHNRNTGKLKLISNPMINIYDSNTGVLWSPMSLDPRSNYVYAMTVRKVSGKYSKYKGALVATNLNNGKIIFKYNTEKPLLGGVLANKGDLVFFGDGDGNVKALNSKDGTLLWKTKCNAGANAPPIAYSINNKEFIAIGCGGSSNFNFKRGNKFYVYSL
jgi:alcohol dehydrogenase (cytochrome c)